MQRVDKLVTYEAVEVAEVLNLVVGEFECLNLVVACQVLQIASFDLIVAKLDLQFRNTLSEQSQNKRH